MGQIKILSSRQSVDALINEESTNSELRQQLILAKKARLFANSHLGLGDAKSFSSYADTGRSHVVYNVIATEEFSIQPINWCFPIAGCVPYRGYFNKQSAIEEQQRLKDKGLDTIMYGVSAYSTLGWFADPLLNTFIYSPEEDLVGLIFHELAHSRVYAKDDSDFNEAFATAVEKEGVKRWLTHQTGNERPTHNSTEFAVNEAITNMILTLRQSLQDLYLLDVTDSEKRAQKAALFDQLHVDYRTQFATLHSGRFFPWWFSQDLNNAHLSLLATYHRLVPAFDKLIQQNAGDLDRFYKKVEQLSKLPYQQRHLELKKL